MTFELLLCPRRNDQISYLRREKAPQSAHALSWEDAGRKAVETAAGSLRDLRVAEVTKMDMRVEKGKVTAFRTRVALSFKYEV